MHAIKKSSFLSKLELRPAVKTQFHTANGSPMISTSCIDLPLTIQSHSVTITAMVIDNLFDIDLIIGTKTLTELNALLDFSTNRLFLRKTSFPLKVCHDVSVSPNSTKWITLHGKLPSFLRKRDILFKPESFVKPHCPFHSDQILLSKHGVYALLLSNSTSAPLRFKANSVMGVADFSDFPSLPERYMPLLQNSQENLSSTSDSPPPQVKTPWDRQKLYEYNCSKYPFLDHSDPLLQKSQKEILHSSLPHDNCLIPLPDLLNTVSPFADAFSLYGEIGHCPSRSIDIQVKPSTKPFQIRPYPMSPSDKIHIDKEMNRLVKLGVLKVGYSEYNSPIMLLPKRNQPGAPPRIVSDFRFLNKNLSNPVSSSFPHLRETLQQIGQQRPTVFSVLDLRDAFHALPLTKSSQRYCGILPYSGSKGYTYQVLPMGLSVSPGLFSHHMSDILSNIPDSKTFATCLLDDLFIFSPDIQTHKQHVSTILEKLVQEGLKLSPKKAQFFLSDVIYLGHHFFTKDGHTCIKPTTARCKAIRQLAPPKDKTSLKRFLGMLTYISMFLPDIQNTLTPLYKMTRKTTPFIWTSECQNIFDKIKSLLVNPPVLCLPTGSGPYKIESDASRTHIGGVLYELQDDQWRIIAYFSRKIHSTTKTYSVTEIEFLAICTLILHWRYILRNTHFSVVTDHAAIKHLLTNKHELATKRLKLLYEKISDFSFDVYYKQGKSLTLVDFLSRANAQTDPPLEEIIGKDTMVFPVQSSNPQPNHPVTRSYAKKHNISIPPIRNADAVPRPRKQPQPPRPQPPAPPVQTNQAPPAPPAPQPPQPHFPIPPVAPVPQQQNPAPAPQPFQPPPLNPPPLIALPPPILHPPQPANVLPPQDNLDDEPPQRMSLRPKPIKLPPSPSEQYCEPPKSLFQPPQPLFTKVKSSDIISKSVKQSTTNQLFQEISNRAIRDFNLPHSADDIISAQKTCPFFKPIYEYLAYNTLPSPKKAARSLVVRAEQFLLVQNVLFRYVSYNDGDFKLCVCIPEAILPAILHLYHNTLLSSHGGIQRMYLTLRSKIFTPRLYEHILQWVKTCSVCSQLKDPKTTVKEFQTLIPSDYNPYEICSVDLCQFHTTPSGYTYALIALCPITRHVTCVALKTKSAPDVATALLEHVIFRGFLIKTLQTDLGREWNNQVMAYIAKILKIEHKFISPQLHQQLRAERAIGTVRKLILSHLTNVGNEWPKFCAAAAFSHNLTCSTATGYSPYECVFARPPPDFLPVTLPAVPQGSFEQYLSRVKRRFEVIKQNLLNKQEKIQLDRQQEFMQKRRNVHTYVLGQLVYLLCPAKAALHNPTSRKMTFKWTGPFEIIALDGTYATLRCISSGLTVVKQQHIDLLKPAFVRLPSGTATTASALRNFLSKDKKPQTSQTDVSSPSPVITNEHDENVKCSAIEADIPVLGPPVDFNTDHILPVLQTNNFIAAPVDLTTRKKVKLLKRLDESPRENTTLEVTRFRFKKGTFQLLFSLNESHSKSVWLDCDHHPQIFNFVENLNTTNPNIRVSGSI